jgi:hypothetical protein
MAALSGAPQTVAAEKSSDLPKWLKAHVGNGQGRIADVVLRRARALYEKKVREGAVKNPCYLAMDATRPGLVGRRVGMRFYVICEAKRLFRAFSSGHGGGSKVPGVANFANGRRCAKHFSNAMDSRLSTGGAYVTAEEKTSFKGYYRAGKKEAELIRTFIQFDGAGDGDTANARPREIGGHPAVLLRSVCLRKRPKNPHANAKGYVPFGKLVDYSGGRSSGCTSWSRSEARKIIPILKGNPTTLYIYPESGDIAAVARAVKARKSPARAGLYWNASCLKEIGAPKFWPKEKLEPVIAKYKKDHPPPPPRPTPICKGR